MCELSGRPKYIWYKNGQHEKKAGNEMTYSKDITIYDSFSCAVEGYKHLYSPLECKSSPQHTDMIADVMDLLVKTMCILTRQTDHH